MHDETVVDTEAARKQLPQSNTDHAIAGAISGFVTRFTCQPLDVIKIRFQVRMRCKILYNISLNNFLLSNQLHSFTQASSRAYS